MDLLKKIAGYITEFVTPIYVLRAPLTAAILAFIALSVPYQMYEIFRAMALDRADKWPEIILAFGTLFLAGLLLWYIGRNLTLLWQPEEVDKRTLQGELLRWLPRICGALPLFGSAVGLLQAARSLRAIETPPWLNAQTPEILVAIEAAKAAHESARQILHFGAGLAAFLGLVIIAFTVVRGFRKQWRFERPNAWLFSLPARIFFYVITVGFVLAFSFSFLGSPESYGRIADFLGTFTIFNLFLICFSFFLAALTNIYDRSQFPALSVLAVVAIGATAFDLNDNHVIRTQKDAYKPLASSVKAFEDWLASRPDRDFYKQRNEPYPVYIVAAQGGGLYAAQQAAFTLARLEDRCPAFAQHVFAMSGVSGGALGTGLFSALVAAKSPGRITNPACAFGDVKPGWYEEKAKAFLGRDFLSPLAGAMLFPDFLQRFIPYPIPPFDRARAIEAAFERAWAETVKDATGNPFAQSFYGLWDSEGVTPALILNATDVRTGVRVVLSPFRFFRQSTLRLLTINNLMRADFTLSTAVGISARFPWILPPASWTTKTGQEYRFADGGYFESSGVETALDLSQVIDDLEKSRLDAGKPSLGIKVNLIMFSTDDILEDPVNTNNSAALETGRTKAKGFDEALSPIDALLNTRWQRGVVSVARAYQKFCVNCFRDREDRRIYSGLDGDARLFRLNFTDFELTLGWQLSSISKGIIAAHAGSPEHCLAARASLRDRWPWVARVFNENNCSSCKVMYSLTGREAELQNIAPSVTLNGDRVKGNNVQGPLPNWVALCRSDAPGSNLPTYSAPAPSP